VKLASLKEGGRDGTLVVVSRDLARAVPVADIAATLQAALDHWDEAAPRLAEAYDRLNDGALSSAIALDPAALAAPLPRAYQWLDGSAYLSHVERVRKARGAAMPPDAATAPLMYRGGSVPLLGPRDPILVADESSGIDIEAEVAVIVGDVPMAAPPESAGRAIRLVMLANDISLRHLIPGEFAKGLGFVHSKPPPAFSPVAVTPDEFGAAWDGTKVRLPLLTHINGALFGRPNAGVDMTFDFPALIVHAATTRPLGAGTIVGSGTVSNRNARVGFSCIAEKRAIEVLESGTPKTPFLRFGDRVRIEMVDADGLSVLGAIEQKVVRYTSLGAAR
jgi:fumarylacetoacetate (FAA) hydrolase